MAIRSVGIVGAGTMGGGIATNVAQHGLEVRLLDAQPAAVERAQEAAATFYARAVERGRMTVEAAAEARMRLRKAQGLSDVAAADLVIEAVFEDFDLKIRLFGELSSLLADHTIVATNTSCLRVGDLQAHVAGPARFLGLHYFSPAALNPIVEVVSGADTSPATIDAALAFCRVTGKRPLRCRDSWGFAINRFFCPYTNEAARLLDEGVAGAAEIDAVAREAVGAAAGPFTVMNLIKPRINLHAIRNLAPLGPFYAPADAMTTAGEADRPFEIGTAQELPPAARATIVDRLRAGAFLPVLQELDEAVATPEDIDTGAREALKFARPPCALMRELGRAEVRRTLAPLLERWQIAEPRSLEALIP